MDAPPLTRCLMTMNSADFDAQRLRSAAPIGVRWTGLLGVMVEAEKGEGDGMPMQFENAPRW